MIIPKRERILLPPERKRDKQLKIWVSQEEQEMIQQKMAEFGTTNLGAFVRKMVIDGYIIKLDTSDIRQMISLLRHSSNNLNQIARRANQMQVTTADLKEAKLLMREINDRMKAAGGDWA